MGPQESTDVVGRLGEKKLKRVVKSSTAAETHARINAMDAIDFFQALSAETIHGVTPKKFRLYKC